MFWSSPADFQQMFGALLAAPEGRDLDPALVRALTIHHNTATKAAVDALADNYPVLKALVGEEAFTGSALAYVTDHPPGEPRLCVYGETFPDFVASYLLGADTAYLHDCALLERAVVEALFATDAVAATGQDFAEGVDLDKPLILHPATRFLRCASPAASIWLAHQPHADFTLEALDWAQEACLVTRPAGAVLVQSLDPATAALLSAMTAGASLGEAAEAAVAVGDLSTAFVTLLSAGAFLQPASWVGA
jgi:Putative DNA-binding domain